MAGRIVIVEDEPLIALEIEQSVVDADGVVAGVVRTVSEALALLDEVACDGAVLDANLAGESAEPIVARLKEKLLPYIVVSGYLRSQLDFLDDAAPLVGKPFAPNQLSVAIRDHLIDATKR